MSTFQGAHITEIRIYDDPSNPADSDYKVALPETVFSAVKNPDTGKSLVDLLNQIEQMQGELSETTYVLTVNGV